MGRGVGEGDGGEVVRRMGGSRLENGNTTTA